MKNRRPCAAFIVILLLAAGLGPAFSLELYMNATVLLDGSRLTTGDLVRAPAGRPAPPALLDLWIDVDVKEPCLVPQRLVREALAEFRGAGGFALVGGRTAVVPTERYGGHAAAFLWELLAFLDLQESRKDGRLELEILNPFMIPTREGAGTPSFRLIRADRRMGYLAGEAEVAFRLPDGDEEADWGAGGVLELRIGQHVPVAHLTTGVERYQPVDAQMLEYREMDVSRAAADYVLASQAPKSGVAARDLRAGTALETGFLEEARGVLAGEELRIHFVHGAVRMETTGRALRGGSIGDAVMVRPHDVAKSFEGRVIGPREVLIELP